MRSNDKQETHPIVYGGRSKGNIESDPKDRSNNFIKQVEFGGKVQRTVFGSPECFGVTCSKIGGTVPNTQIQ